MKLFSKSLKVPVIWNYSLTVICSSAVFIRPLIIKRSNTRHEELLVPEGDLQRAWLLRKAFNDLNSAEAMELLIDKVSKYKTNSEFLQNMNK